MAMKKPSIVPVREQIYEYVKQAIITNEYKPGELLSIEHLAHDFGVSATPIREALIRLENSGLLNLIPNKGAVVTDYTKEDVHNAWEMRRLLEPYAGRITAKLDVRKEITALEHGIKAIMEGPFKLPRYIELDRSLHELLFAYVPNDLLRETLSRILENSMRMRYFAEGTPISQADTVAQVCAEHLEILAALRSKDPERAEQTICSHIETGERRTLFSLEHAER